MKILSLSLITLFLSSCASVGESRYTYKSESQNFRIKNEEKTTEIKGQIDKIYNGVVSSDTYMLSVFFNNELALKTELSDDYTGEGSNNWHNKKIATSCSSKRISNNFVDVKCIVFIDNERTVTLSL